MSNKTNQPERTLPPNEKQRAQLANLKRNFDLSDDEIRSCLIFGPDQDPWIPPKLLLTIARRTQKFADIDPDFITHVPSLNQIMYKARVTDLDGRTISRIGVATIGERSGGIQMDAHKLAEGRAIGAALEAQGFNPYRSNFVDDVDVAPKQIPVQELPSDEEIENAIKLQAIEDEAEWRRHDLKQIHKLAKEKGLIFYIPGAGEFKTRYRDWLSTNFQTQSASMLDPEGRAMVINALRLYEEQDYLLNIPQELHEDALIA